MYAERVGEKIGGLVLEIIVLAYPYYGWEDLQTTRDRATYPPAYRQSPKRSLGTPIATTKECLHNKRRLFPAYREWSALLSLRLSSVMSEGDKRQLTIAFILVILNSCVSFEFSAIVNSWFCNQDASFSGSVLPPFRL